MHVRTFLVTLALLTMSAAFSTAHLSAQPQSGFEGAITVSPWHPGPVRADEPASKPLANASFIVQNEKNELATEFTTDAQGRFRVPLAPGRYKVLLKGKKSGVGKFGPFDVEVVAGKMTPIQWQCDSGMR